MSFHSRRFARDPGAVDAWIPGIDDARRAAKHAIDPFLFLHLPKSGGTTIKGRLERLPDWNTAKFPHYTQRVGQLCTCNDPECTFAQDYFDALAQLTPRVVRGKKLVVTNVHATYEQTRWLSRAVAPRGVTALPILTTVRPARDRVVSMFRDYWDKYFTAVLARDGKLDLSIDDPAIQKTFHGDAVRRKAVIDSQRFLPEEGRIDGRLWFESFNPGRGFPFWLTEVFDSPEQLADAMDSGALRVVPIHRLDDALVELTSQPPVRYRVSHERVPEVEAALEEAADIVDRLSSQDDDFDALLTDRFGSDFTGAPSKAKS